MIKIIYVSGTRADFGLMQSALTLLHHQDHIDLSICATAMHLYEEYGLTIRDIEKSGITICDRISVELDQSSMVIMSKALGNQVCALTDCFAREKPDLVILLGDRGEMLAGAVAAMHLEIPTLHLHGGEISGHIDDRVRHAISVMSDYHCPATEVSKARLINMGIDVDKIFVTGAPGLDELQDYDYPAREELAQKYGFESSRPIAFMQFHPVHDEYEDMTRQAEAIFEAAHAQKIQMMCMLPNADAGGHFIRDVIKVHDSNKDIRVSAHLGRQDFLSFLAASDVMIGNSSAGIIEAASFGLPVINIGNRQNNRERNANVIDVDADVPSIEKAIKSSLENPKPLKVNLYGDGKAGERLLEFVNSIFDKKDVVAC